MMCLLLKISYNSEAFCECSDEWRDIYSAGSFTDKLESMKIDGKKAVETPYTLMNCRQRWIPLVSFATCNVHRHVKATFKHWDEWDDIYAAGSFSDKLESKSVDRKKAVDKPCRFKRHLTLCGKYGPRRFPLQPPMNVHRHAKVSFER